MTTALYIQFILVGVLGALLQALFKIKSIRDKAKLSNVAFKSIDYWKEDYLSHSISLITIVLVALLVGDILKIAPDYKDYTSLAFAFIGYTSNDIASRVFGAVNKRVNDVIDKKTSVADQVTEENEPTPHK